MDYDRLNVKELKKICKERQCRNYSKLRKRELVSLLEDFDMIEGEKCRIKQSTS